MNTREEIISLANALLRNKGFNAFSFHDLSKSIGIKTASIHYHFPTKSDLVIAVIKQHIHGFEALKASVDTRSPIQKLEAFFSIYAKIHAENNICLVGSLATDLHTVDAKVRNELKKLADLILAWVTEIVKEGKEKKVFKFKVPPRTKAIMIITNMLAIVQLVRLTNEDDFIAVKETIIKELKSGK